MDANTADGSQKSGGLHCWIAWPVQWTAAEPVTLPLAWTITADAELRGWDRLRELAGLRVRHPRTALASLPHAGRRFLGPRSGTAFSLGTLTGFVRYERFHYRIHVDAPRNERERTLFEHHDTLTTAREQFA